MSEIFLHPAIPAATLVLFRDAHAAPPDLLMVERSANMAFAAGAWAFPGGRVDEDDHIVAARFGTGLDADDAAGRVAAIRETLEETGIATGFATAKRSTISAQTRREMRMKLHKGALFSHILDENRLHLDLKMLIPFARWRPNFAEARIFDARFYLARLPDDQDAEHIDDGENAQLFWASAADTLARCAQGAGRIIFPTRRNLERLATYADYDAAVAHAREFDAARMITPWMEDRNGVRHLCIPDDMGYPVTAEPVDSAMRG